MNYDYRKRSETRNTKIMRKTTTLYKKVGKRYIKHDDYLDDVGLPQGLYLFYKKGNAMMSIMHYAKVHDIQNVGRFCDLYVAHYDKINEALRKATYDNHDLTMKIISELSNIDL